MRLGTTGNGIKMNNLDTDKERILAIWPDAVWMPSDVPPVGQRIMDDDGNTGTIICRFGYGQGKPSCSCPDCKNLNCLIPDNDDLIDRKSVV